MKKYGNIPPEIARKLDQSVGRVRRILFVRGVAMTVAVAVASLLAIMAIDAMVMIFSPWIRWGLWAVAVAGTCAVAWFALLKPMRRRFTASEIALLIERNHPELEERLSTVVELAQEGDTEQSKRLIEALTVDAIRDAGKVSPQKEFTSRTIKPRLLAAVAALIVLFGLFAAFPTATKRLATRALVPSAEVDNIYASSLKVTPGDQTILAGSSFTVNLAVDGGFPSKAYVRTRQDGKGEAVERMSKTSEEGAKVTTYQFNYPSVSKSFTYRMNCGSGLTRGYRVNVVSEPSFSDRVIEIEHPEYTGRPADRYTNTAAVVGLAGSTVRVSVKPSRADLTGEALLPGDRRVAGEVGEDGRMTFEFDLREGGDGSWGVSLWDANGFSNRMETAAVTVAKDVPPAVTLIEPQQAEFNLPKAGELPIAFEIKEDFGISRVVLEMCLGAGEWKEMEDLLTTKTGGVTWTGDKIVRFAALEFGNAGTVRFRVKAEDTLPEDDGGPGAGMSSEIMVTFVSHNTSLARQSLSEQIKESKKATEDVLQCLKKARRNVNDSGEGFASDNQWRRNGAKQQLEAGRSDTVNGEKLLAEFIEGLLESRLQTGAELFRPVLDKFLTPTRQEIEDIFLLARDEEKSEAAKKGAKSIDEVIAEFEKAKKVFDKLTKTAENLQKLEEYAEREKALAEMAEKGEIDYKELADQQENLEKRFEEDFREELNKKLAWQKDQAENLKKKGDALAKKQAEIREKSEAAKKGTDEQKKAVADEEKQLARDIGNLMNETARLAEEIEKLTGPVEADPLKTAEPVRDAKESAREAHEDAQKAADKMNEGDFNGAKDDMKSVEEALAQAQSQLTDAQSKIDAANEAFAAESQEYRDMQSSLHEAAETARTAAEEQAAMESQQSSSQWDGEKSDIGELPQSDQQHQGEWDGEKMEGGEMQQSDQQHQGEWDGKKTEGGEMQQSDQQHKGEWDGKKMPTDQQAQQQGQQQNGEKQQGGEQQQGQQQPQTAAQQAAQKAAQDAANKMQGKAEQQAQQNGLPLDQFQQQGQQQQGPQQQGKQQQGKQQQGQQSNSKSGPKDPNAKHDPQSKNDKHGEEAKSRDQPKGVQGGMDLTDDGEEWFKMKSESSAGAEADPMDDVPEEYRGLVKDYFNALNKGGKE